MSAVLPEVVQKSGARSERLHEVCPVLDKGGDPFTLIMRSTGELADDEALRLVVGFERAPLHAVTRGRGRAAHTEQSDGAYHVWFYRNGPARQPQAPPPDGSPAPLRPPVEMDVRGLEPPAARGRGAG